ncbi:HNH endonuclease signature motif containing protein [Microbacterium schleiferi]|uniref:HNH endonuclease signature motif containing protein n=1 Tax=Microbacterium schleiferi TaxID=69362 RepID=UPI00311EDAD4
MSSRVHGRVTALVDDLVATRRKIAALQAREARLLAYGVDLALERAAELGSSRSGSDLGIREIAAELGAAMRISDRTVQNRMGEASTLLGRFGGTHAALEHGEVDASHARVIVDAGAGISDDHARARYEQLALEIARRESPNRLRPAARAIAASIDPESPARLRRLAAEAHAVRVQDLDDGLARLIADLPAPLAYAIHDRLTQTAHHVCDTRVAVPGDEQSPAEPAADARTMDQLRADVLADLLLTATPTAHGDPEITAAITGRVQVSIPLRSLAGATDEPGILAGYGPVDPALIRDLAGRAPGWDRIFTDTSTGLPVAVDRYRPDAALRRYLSARDEHCRFPGCRRPAQSCDIDHTIDAARGGPTAPGNLAHFCKRHHILKHDTAWTVKQLPGGVLEWTSPSGRTYTDNPAPTVRFIPDPEPIPAPAPF